MKLHMQNFGNSCVRYQNVIYKKKKIVMKNVRNFVGYP